VKLNQQQQAAVDHRDGPILILAGAGSGKTRVIINRIINLITKEEIPSWQILAVTFTNKAATEMKERIAAFSNIQRADEVNIGTFHSICVRILRRECEKIGLHRNFTICDDSEQIARIKIAIAEADLNTDRMKPKVVQSAISKFKNNFRTPQDIEKDAGANVYSIAVAKVYYFYERALKSDHSMDFDDLIIRTVNLFKNEPEVLEKYQNRYRYIMIDEYQDTNQAQYEFVTLLAQRFRNVMAVGDDDQSIYKWRGAEVTNILNFEKDFPGSRTIKLEQNYRSTQIILSAATELMKNNQDRHKKALWSNRKDGEQIEYKICSSDREEAETIARVIKSKVEREDKKYSDFAVFYRINAQSRVLEEMFHKSRIPNRIVGNISFFKRKEVKDLLAYIRLTLNPFDSGACRRIINVPRRGIGKKTQTMLEKIAEDKNLDLFSAVDVAVSENLLSSNKAKHLQIYLELINDLIRYERTHTAQDYVKHCIESTGYRSLYEQDNSAEAQASLEIISEFENMVTDFTQRTDGNLSEFADYLSLHNTDEDDVEDNTDKVNLMTLHNAKGLEFPVVFISGLEDGLSPLIRTGDADEGVDIEEERRLFYVGMTRAKDKLYLTGAEFRVLYGKSMKRTPSRFIHEIPDEFVEVAKKKSVKQSSRIATLKVQYDYSIGERVYHGSWKNGTILSCSGSGPKAKLIISFDRYGKKKIMAGLANLVRLK